MQVAHEFKQELGEIGGLLKYIRKSVGHAAGQIELNEAAKDLEQFELAIAAAEFHLGRVLAGLN